MGVPKRKSSKQKIRQRKAAQATRIKYPAPSGTDLHLPHRVSPTTGMYKGRQVLVVSSED